MEIRIHSSDLLTPKRRALAEDEIRDVLVRHGRRILAVTVHLWDVNGPRSGVDHRCRIVVTLRDSRQIVVTGDSTAFTPLIKRTAERAAYAVRRHVNRLRAKQRRIAPAVERLVA
jgi:hypothetical protein